MLRGIRYLMITYTPANLACHQQEIFLEKMWINLCLCFRRVAGSFPRLRIFVMIVEIVDPQNGA